MRELREGWKEHLAVIGGVWFDGELGRFTFEIKIDESLSSVDSFGAYDLGELVMAYRLLDLNQLVGKPIWAQSGYAKGDTNKMTMYLRPWKGAKSK